MKLWHAWDMACYLQLVKDVVVFSTAIGVGIGWVIVIVRTAIWIAP